MYPIGGVLKAHTRRLVERGTTLAWHVVSARCAPKVLSLVILSCVHVFFLVYEL